MLLLYGVRMHPPKSIIGFASFFVPVDDNPAACDELPNEFVAKLCRLKCCPAVRTLQPIVYRAIRLHTLLSRASALMLARHPPRHLSAECRIVERLPINDHLPNAPSSATGARDATTATPPPGSLQRMARYQYRDLQSLQHQQTTGWLGRPAPTHPGQRTKKIASGQS